MEWLCSKWALGPSFAQDSNQIHVLTSEMVQCGDQVLPGTRSRVQRESIRRSNSYATDSRLGIITARRINIVEPDGTVRLSISNRADFPTGCEGKRATIA